MIDDTLQRLLDTERRAQEIVQRAEAHREKAIEDALKEARREQERFEARVPELHESFVSKGEARAEQTINELKRRYDEHHQQVRKLAETRDEKALEAAFGVITDARL